MCPTASPSVSSHPLAYLETSPRHFISTTAIVPIGRVPNGNDTRPLARIPTFLPLRGWEIEKYRSYKHGFGYLRYKSRATKPGIKRGARCHREVIEHLLGRALTPEEHIHHQDFNKLNNCPCNLILMPKCLNPSGARQDPYTAEFLSRDEYARRYPAPRISFKDVPDWVNRQEFE